MSPFSSTLGALLIAVLLNTYLYGVATVQYVSYYYQQFQDPKWIRFTIGGLFVTDTFHSICIIYMAWVYAVEDFGNVTGLIQIIWPFPLSAIMMTFTAFIVQLFLSYRILLLTKKYVIAIPLAVLSLGCFVSGMFVGVKVWLAETMLELSTVNTVLTFWLTAETAIDLSIAVILLFTLYQSRSGLKGTDRVVKHLMRTSLQTGLCTGIFATLCMILFLARPGTQYYLMFGLPISRVYTCTLLDTLLSRDTLRGMLEGSDTYVGSSLFGASGGTVSALQSAPRNRDIETLQFNPSHMMPGNTPMVALELTPTTHSGGAMYNGKGSRM